MNYVISKMDTVIALPLFFPFPVGGPFLFRLPHESVSEHRFLLLPEIQAAAMHSFLPPRGLGGGYAASSLLLATHLGPRVP